MPAIRGPNSKRKTRRRLRDVDQVYADLRDARHLSQYKDTKAVEDLPALGRHYCVECAKWFESDNTLKDHTRGKVHKRRLKQLKEEPYSQREAEAAVGRGVDNGRSRTDVMVVDQLEMPDAKAALVSDNAQPEEDDSVEYDAFMSVYNQPVEAR